MQSDDPIGVELTGQRERLLEKAAALEKLGRAADALTIYDALVALYPEDPDVRAARATARRALAGETSSPAASSSDREEPTDPREIATIDAGRGEHP